MVSNGSGKITVSSLNVLTPRSSPNWNVIRSVNEIHYERRMDYLKLTTIRDDNSG